MKFFFSYVAWNVHEPFKGKYSFTGDNDLVKFIKLAQKNDLLVILRPGPYISADWEYGGFPYWVMREFTPSGLRTHDDSFMILMERWLSVLFTKLRPLLYENGGPIISLQVCNLYTNSKCLYQIKAQNGCYRKRSIFIESTLYMALS